MENTDKQFYFLSGFELTRKIVLQGATTEISDMLRELADILEDIEIEDGDKMSSLSVNNITSVNDSSQVKILATLVSAPKK
jgi:hypothetical protein